MKRDPLKQYVSLRDSLLKRKAALEAELAQINAALGEPAPAKASAAKAAPARSRKRAQNSVSLKSAVCEVLKSKPLTRPDILKAVEKTGYVFTAKDPLNSLNTLLYSNKKVFKNLGDGTFGLA
jgi:hypothetical protein